MKTLLAIIAALLAILVFGWWLLPAGLLVVGALGMWFWPIVVIAVVVAVLIPALKAAGSVHKASEPSADDEHRGHMESRVAMIRELQEAKEQEAPKTEPDDVAVRLARLDRLREQGVVTDEEYASGRAKILADI